MDSRLGLSSYGQELVLSVQWTTYLTLAYGAFYLFDFFLLSRSFVSASVHLVLFSMVVKLFSVQRDRDLLYLAVLSLLMVLAAAVPDVALTGLRVRTRARCWRRRWPVFPARTLPPGALVNKVGTTTMVRQSGAMPVE